MAWDLPPLNSELDAVNVVLRAKGLEAATQVDLEDAEIADAVFHLDTQDRMFQAKGWWFNKDYSLQLSIANDGTVPLPDGTLSVASSYFYPAMCPPVVERQNKLYDLSKKSFTFTTAPVVDIVVRQNYPDMPEVARRYVAIKAAHIAQGLDQGNTTTAQITGGEVLQALVGVEHEQDRQQMNNAIHGNISMIGSLYGWRGMVRKSNG